MRLRRKVIPDSVMSEFQQEVLENLDKIGKDIQVLKVGQSEIEGRVRVIEHKAGTDILRGNTNVHQAQFGSSGRHDGLGPSDSSEEFFSPVNPDIQGEYQNIKDTVQKINLAPEYRLNDSGNRSGIKKQDQIWANSIARSARYVETSLKLLADIKHDKDNIDIERLFVVQLAHIKFLQEEFQSVIVKGLFDDNTGKVFRTLQKNTSPLSPEAVQTLRNTTQIVQAQAILNQQSSYGAGGFRGGFRGGYRGGNRGGFRSDRYHSFANRNFTGYSNRGRGADRSGYNQGFSGNFSEFRNQDAHDN